MLGSAILENFAVFLPSHRKKQGHKWGTSQVCFFSYILFL